MKFRTDFVTNSSSSSFTVTVTVESKDGKSYRFSRGASPFADERWDHYDFHGDLSRLMKDRNARTEIDNCLKELLSMEADNYDKVLLKETDQAASIIEGVSVGDEVVLMPKGTGWDVLLEVFYQDKIIGVFPKQKGNALGNWIFNYVLRSNSSDKKQIGAYISRIVSVTPISKQKKSTVPKVYVSVDLMLNDVTIPERGLDFENVEGLCRFLSTNVYDGNSWGNEANGKPDSRFIKNASAGIKNISDVSKIIVEREWNAWGEGADLFAENDAKLCDLANDVVICKDDPKVKKIALQAMKDYINSDEYADSMDWAESGFGQKCAFHYMVKGGDKALEKVAERLCTNYGPDRTHGIEHFELNVLTGDYKADAYLDLQ